MVNNKLVYSRGFKNNVIGIVDSFIEQNIIKNISKDFVFVNTTWIEKTEELVNILDKSKVTICYSGPDWENTNCIDIRKHAHKIIKENSSDVLHIGNTRGKYYFNFWAEFIRQNSKYFFQKDYLAPPNFKKAYMCLNRKPHNHRLFLVNLLEKKNLIDYGYVSIFRGKQSLKLNETHIPNINLGQNAVVDDIDINNDILSLGDISNWNSHFLNIVTETTVHTDMFISEKTWKPIIGQRPFLILGDYNIYNYLKDIDIDTFDDLFGQWYNDYNWEHRAISIVEIVDNYKNEDFKKIYKKIKHRLIKNRIRFIEYVDENYEKIKNKLFFKRI